MKARDLLDELMAAAFNGENGFVNVNEIEKKATELDEELIRLDSILKPLRFCES